MILFDCVCLLAGQASSFLGASWEGDCFVLSTQQGAALGARSSSACLNADLGRGSGTG